MPPAARIGDMHTCPMVDPGPKPHVGGPVSKGEPKVVIGFMPAARLTDMATCVGPPDSIAKGSASVQIAYLPAARMGDPTMHGGLIVLGCPTVMIGDMGISLFEHIVRSVNPGNGTINCGFIIDAAIDRLTGDDPSATAPTEQDGSWEEIEARHNTTFDWDSSFEDAFDAVRDGGDGTIGLVGIGYSDGATSHVVVIANQNGTVAILEGQGGGEVITTPERANAVYNSDGGSTVGVGIVGGAGD